MDVVGAFSFQFLFVTTMFVGFSIREALGRGKQCSAFQNTFCFNSIVFAFSSLLFPLLPILDIEACYSYKTVCVGGCCLL